MSSLTPSDTIRSPLKGKLHLRYAQTNLQLFNQLCCDDYSGTELEYIFNAYHLATTLFTGWFRSSGKTFIAHLVGTASILSSLHAPAKVVCAGLLHAVYSRGNLRGSGKRGISEAQRQQLLDAVGPEVEKYVARYTKLKWNKHTIPIIRDSLDSLELIDREVLLIRLANNLEEYLDFGLFYCTEVKREKYSNHSERLVVEIAEKLGFPSLATELVTAQREIALAEIPVELRNRMGNRSGQKSSYFIKPC